jgi:hypothetical protein
MPDDHYCCKICGEFYCRCPPANPPLPPRTYQPPKPLTMEQVLLTLAQQREEAVKKNKPVNSTLDFRDNSVTWKFDTFAEAQEFFHTINKIVNGET